MTAEEREGSFHHKKVGPRAAIVAAGPIANFILAIVIFAGLFTFFGKPSTTARVDKVEAGSAAEAAGFQAGDIVTAIDGKAIGSFSDMQRIVGTRAGETTDVRDQARRYHVAIARHAGTEGNQGPVRQHPSAWRARNHPRDVARGRHDRTCGSGGRALAGRQGDLVRGRPHAGLYRRDFHRARGGRPGRRTAADRPDFRAGRDIGLAALIHLAAVLSVSIGLLNLFPVPLLDGGHLLFYAVEAVRGRPLSERAQEMGFRIGLGLVLMLMVFATYNDILHLAAS